MLAHWKTGQKKIWNEANIGKNVADIGEIILKRFKWNLRRRENEAESTYGERPQNSGGADDLKQHKCKIVRKGEGKEKRNPNPNIHT